MEAEDGCSQGAVQGCAQPPRRAQETADPNKSATELTSTLSSARTRGQGYGTIPQKLAEGPQGHSLTQYWIWNHKVMPSNTHTKVCVKPPHNFCPQQKEGTKRPDRSLGGGGTQLASFQVPQPVPPKAHSEHGWCQPLLPQASGLVSPGHCLSLALAPTLPESTWQPRSTRRNRARGNFHLRGLNEHPEAAGLSSALFIKNRFSLSPSPLLAKGSYPTFFSQINEITNLGGSRS